MSELDWDMADVGTGAGAWCDMKVSVRCETREMK